MNFHAVETGFLGQKRGVDERFFRRIDFIQRHGARAGFAIVRRANGLLAGKFLQRPHAAVYNLCIGKTAVLFDAISKPLHAVKVRVAYCPELAIKSFAVFLGKGRACHGQAKAAFGALGQPFIFVVRQCAVIMALQIGQGGQHKPVGHLHAAYKCETG